ncbi:MULTISPECIES: hypothetical protein [unclassified Mycobacterium]|uniref:hypothetical protein n=1 Tax=unclassified Mycobacterium TaxID=2642494 RepID=UPI0007FE8928|nr:MULTISPECIES: hypothetical protein [unclassified Mycobacterium]OBG99818.1 hypothetical protein A5696_17060 [Mycobacterium sp. E2699]OBI54512.1 hypothetical protein A5705_25965 [Mycobacterium sp. E787]
MDLAARVKRLEDSAVAVKERNEAALVQRRRELETAIEHEVEELKKTTGEAEDAARGWWSDTKGAIERQIAAMRADFEKRKADFEHKNAERAAASAEEDAAVAANLASYCVDAAEWAAVRAELARAEAEKQSVRS